MPADEALLPVGISFRLLAPAVRGARPRTRRRRCRWRTRGRPGPRSPHRAGTRGAPHRDDGGSSSTRKLGGPLRRGVDTAPERRGARGGVTRMAATLVRVRHVAVRCHDRVLRARELPADRSAAHGGEQPHHLRDLLPGARRHLPAVRPAHLPHCRPRGNGRIRRTRTVHGSPLRPQLRGVRAVPLRDVLLVRNDWPVYPPARHDGAEHDDREPERAASRAVHARRAHVTLQPRVFHRTATRGTAAGQPVLAPPRRGGDRPRPLQVRERRLGASRGRHGAARGGPSAPQRHAAHGHRGALRWRGVRADLSRNHGHGGPPQAGPRATAPGRGALRHSGGIARDVDHLQRRRCGRARGRKRSG